MRTIQAMALAAVAALSMTPEPPAPPVAGPTISGPAISGPSSTRSDQQLAATCPKTGEQTSGMNKICFYNCVGSMAAITVGAAQLCPLFIQG